MLTYELLDTRLLADEGTISPVKLTGPFPVIVIPTQPITIRAEKRTCRIGKGQFVLLLHPEYNIYMVPSNSEGFAPVYSVSFNSYQLAKRENDTLLYVADTTHLPAHGQIMEFPRYAEGLLKNLMEQFHQTQKLNAAPKLHLRLHELLDTIFERKSIDISFMTNDQAIQQAVTYIKQHFEAPLTRSFMANMTGFNESYFSSLFKKETGWSFAEYVNQIRIDQAKLMLLATNDKLHDIALKTGFADGSYLGKTFTKYVHLSPSNFRKRRHTNRIVSIQFLGALLALGIQPLATTRELLQSSQLLHNRLPHIVEIESFDQVEVIRHLDPELIVAPTYLYNYPEILKALEQIAPVLTIPWGHLDKLEEVRLLGTLLGRTKEAEHWIAKLQQSAMEARKVITPILESGATAGIFELGHDNLWLIPYLSVRSAYTLNQLLGLRAPQRIQQEVLQTGKHLKVKEQDLLLYSANHMFLIVPTDDTESFRAKLMQRSVWQRLVYEQGCQLHLLKLHEFWFDDGLSLELQLSVMVNLLIDQS
ncbi:helix-turn-helix domain-containing protein [Lysinibacillus cavernae]|uniref:helix-turn-helix domain-containing protein n=1 Tax=Lysinibacillus cavernae TaxID=2666135 RepID=UPI0012D96A1A|nr:helix-turn-helix domain-containing protein [Lysinibacillus cavernae]